MVKSTKCQGSHWQEALSGPAGQVSLVMDQGDLILGFSRTVVTDYCSRGTFDTFVIFGLRMSHSDLHSTCLIILDMILPGKE